MSARVFVIVALATLAVGWVVGTLLSRLGLMRS